METTSKDIEYRRKQLNELFGPLFLNRQTSHKHYKLLQLRMGVTKDEKPDWRLVNHIEEVQAKNDQLATSSVMMILTINKEIAKTLKSHWGLIEEPHQTYIDFPSHQAMLQQAWDECKNQPPGDENVFPRGFDINIEADMKVIRDKLIELTA